MFRLSYNTNGLLRLPLEKAIEEVCKAGYEGIEISLDSAHLHPFDISKERLDKLKQLFDRLPIKPVSLATGGLYLLSDVPCEPSLICPEEEGRKKRISLIDRALEIANHLSIPVLNFTSGYLRRDFVHENVSAEEARQLLVEGIRTCLRNAGDVTMSIEPEAIMYSMFIETTSQAISLIKEINSPQFRLTIDVSHVRCFEPDPMRSITEAVPYARHVHIADIKGRVHHHEIPGEGDIDFRSLFEVLGKGKYQHYVSVELYWHCDEWERALCQSRKYLLEQMKTGEENS